MQQQKPRSLPDPLRHFKGDGAFVRLLAHWIWCRSNMPEKPGSVLPLKTLVAAITAVAVYFGKDAIK